MNRCLSFPALALAFLVSLPSAALAQEAPAPNVGGWITVLVTLVLALGVLAAALIPTRRS